MPGKNENRRLNLFRKYSKNLQIWRPEFIGQYACPICLTTGFYENSIRGPNPRLTDEHGIQNGLGSPCHILTCASCNHTAGKDVDTHLHKRLAFESFCTAAQKNPLNIRMKVGEDSLGIDIIRTGGETPKIDINVIQQQCDKESIERVKELMMKESPEIKLHFDSRSMPNIRNSKVAVLKSAYLLAFRYFGYGYLLSHVMDPIRQSIREPSNPKVPLDDIIFETTIDGLPQNIAEVIYPGDLTALVVPIPVKKYQKGYMIVLPNNESTYERWSKWILENGDPKDMNLRLRVFPLGETYLTDRFMGFGRPQGFQ